MQNSVNSVFNERILDACRNIAGDHQIVAACLYGPLTSGYGNEKSGINTLLILKGFGSRLKTYKKKVGDRDAFVLAVDQRAFQRDVSSGWLGEIAADTLLTNPLAGSAEDVERGRVLFLQFCVMCHGEEGAGNGPVVGPNRLPPLPTLNLLSERALDLSDGYIYGMIANGRGVMPSYRRVQHEDRWYLVEYVRKLQEESPVAK